MIGTTTLVVNVLMMSFWFVILILTDLGATPALLINTFRPLSPTIEDTWANKLSYASKLSKSERNK